MSDAFLAKAARGWKSQLKDHSFWLDPKHIAGDLPPELHGTFFRNGPGQNEIYGVTLKHPIDGDGLVCSLTFVDGRVHFKCKYVGTRNHVEEKKAKKMLYRGQMGTNPPMLPAADAARFFKAMVTGSKPDMSYKNASNTNVFFWGGKLLSCWEPSVPYSLDPYTLRTLGPENFGGAMKLRKFAAHFRYDHARNRLITLGLNPGVMGSTAQLEMIEWDDKWNKLQGRVYEIPGLNYAHDFLLTENYYILQMSPMTCTERSVVFKILMGLSSPGDTMRHYPHLPSKIVVLPRFIEREPWIVDDQPSHVFHFCTARELSPTSLSFTAVRIGKDFTMEFESKLWLSNAGTAPGRLYRYDIDLEACKLDLTQIDTSSAEFPTTHPDLDVRGGGRYVYMMACDAKKRNLPFQDVVKADIDGGRRQVWHYKEGCVGEPVFIPRRPLGAGQWPSEEEEDDGWVIVQVFDAKKQATEFVILDAKHIDRGPMCRLMLPIHIPYAFHGTWCSDVFPPQQARL